MNTEQPTQCHSKTLQYVQGRKAPYVRNVLVRPGLSCSVLVCLGPSWSVLARPGLSWSGLHVMVKLSSTSFHFLDGGLNTT